MNWFQELRQRRVFQITSAYVVGSWGLLQFLAFLESRMTISPHLVNLIGLALVLLLPSVITMAWVHGRPGKDTWGRLPKVVVPANLLAAALLIVIMFNGRDLGAVTRTIAVEDENGAVTERVVPKNEYRRRVLVFYPENSGDQEDDWTRETMAYLLTLDLSQDGFIDVILPLSMPITMREAGSPDGHGISRPLQRKTARDAHIGNFLTGTIEQLSGQWRWTTELHESESGKVVAERTLEAADLFSLADQVSRQLREDLGIPAGHLEENPDLPVAEITSTSIEAVASMVKAMLKITHLNDWEGAVPQLEEAVALDPRFTMAQFLLFGVRQTLGDAEGASAAITVAMENLYRMPERLSFMIKAQYYFNEKQDPDKALAVARMWTQIYPADVNAYQTQATFYIIRQDLPQAIAAYENILAIEPSRVNVLEALADLHTQLGNFDKAEGYLKRYVEIFPTRSDGLEDLSDFYSTTGRLDEARSALTQAQLLDPEDLGLTLGMIDLDIKQGKYDASSQTLADLLDKSESTLERMRIYSRQVNIARLKGRPSDLSDRIDALYSARLEIQNPLQANIIHSLTLPSISECGRPEEALGKLAEVKVLIPDGFKDLVGVGEAWTYADLGRVPEARASLAAAVVVLEAYKFETFRSSIALVEGMIAETEGDLDAAISHYRDSAEMAIVADPSYWVRLARVLRLAGEEDKAKAVIDKSLKADPAHPGYQLELAHLEHLRGNHNQARQHLTLALAAWAEAEPEFLPAQEARQLEALLDTP